MAQIILQIFSYHLFRIMLRIVFKAFYYRVQSSTWRIKRMYKLILMWL